MSEDLSETASNNLPMVPVRRKWTEFWTATDGAVAGICELLALLFGLPFGDDLYHGTPITAWRWFYLAVALVFAVGGPMWPLIRKHPFVSQKVAERVANAAIDPIKWILVLLLLFVYSSAPPWLIRIFSQPAPIDSAHRVFVSITPEQISEFYEGHTGIEGDRLLAPYIGKWTKVTGMVGDIMSVGGGPSILLTKTQDKPSLGYASLNFNKDWEERIATLHKGQTVTAICMISGAFSFSASFSNCELQEDSK